MKAVELTGTLNDNAISVWMCGECQKVAYDEALANRCCVDRCGCGVEVKKYALMCESCRLAHHEEWIQKKYDEAPKVSLADYKHDMVVVHGDGVSVEEWLESEEPKWAFAVSSIGMPYLDAEDILYTLLEDFHPEAKEDVDINDLQNSINHWQEQQVVRWWREDGRIVIRE